MDKGGTENQGTGLTDVIRILAEVPQERLLSLTYQLGKKPEEDIVHALCLIALDKGVQALNKLQTLKGNYLANHLAEKCQISEGKLEDLGVKCGHVQEFMLVELARIFKVLSNHRLCDPLLRDLAYQRALSNHSQKTSDHKHLEYTCTDQLIEEAKQICGPQVVEEMFSSRELRSVSCHYPHLDKGNTALKPSLSQDQSESAHSSPSSLQATYSIASYPSHLEISEAPTARFQGDTITPVTSDHPQPCATALVSEAENATGPSNSSKETPLESNEAPEIDSTMGTQDFATLAAKCSNVDGHIKPNQYHTTVPTTEPKLAPAPKETHERKSAEGEEELTFYSFVILHAPEDDDVAEALREKLESIVVGEGATFSEDFAIPGRSTLMCIEDAINNTAFTILLLTRNFNTRLLEMEADSALINSICKKHKYNTVIPLLPKENSMPKRSMPIVLQTLVALEENKTFERRIKKALSPSKIESQRRVWVEEQRVKEQIKRLERLKLANKRHEDFVREHRTTELLEEERLRWLMEEKLLLFPNAPAPSQHVDGDGNVWLPPQSNIHIENAKYIMIGNDSQMTVGGVIDKDSEEK